MLIVPSCTSTSSRRGARSLLSRRSIRWRYVRFSYWGGGKEGAQEAKLYGQAKFKYNAWKEISHISAQKAQALYIKQVNDLINKYGTRA